jgi:hypothetical protein
MFRTELARVAPALRDVAWPMSGASRWSQVPDSAPGSLAPPSPSSSARAVADADASGQRIVATSRQLADELDDIPWSDCRVSRTG